MQRTRILLGGVGVIMMMTFALLFPANAELDRCKDHPLVCRMVKARLGYVTPEERANPAGAQELRYGDDPKQTISLWKAPGATARTPLIVFVHGGGWTRGDKDSATGPAKIDWAIANGYSFASIDYRLVPAVSVEDEARDVAAAIRSLRGQAASLEFDPDRIVLMGHSAGAHLAALVGTDQRYLGKDLETVRSVVLLDGAGYDVQRQMEQAGRFTAQIYKEPFGALDPATLTMLSPTAQARRPNAAAFLIYYDAQRPDAREQSEALGDALRKAGTRADMVPVEGSTHIGINFDLGKADNIETERLAAFLAPPPVRAAAQ